MIGNRTFPVRDARGAGSSPSEPTSDDYQAGYRFGHAWLLTDEGCEWQVGQGTQASMVVPALRRLTASRGRDYVRGFYDAVTRYAAPAEVRARKGDRKRRTRPITVTVTLSTEEYAALKSVQMADGVPTATRIRAMILAYAIDQEVRRRVDDRLIAEPGGPSDRD